MTATLPANGSDAVMTNASVNSNVIYQPANDNNDTNKKTPTLMATPEIGNQIGENGASSSSSSSQLKRKLNSDETNTTTCVSQNKTSHPTTEEFLMTASAVVDDITHTKIHRWPKLPQL